jgi:hypothetical protein
MRLAFTTVLLTGMAYAGLSYASTDVAPSHSADAAAARCALGPDTQWLVVEGSSSDNYYRVQQEEGRTVFHADYPKDTSTVTLGRRVPDSSEGWRHLSWSWRVHRFPENGNEKMSSREDSAMAVYATFGSQLHRQSLKYVWSTTLPAGTVVGPKRTLFYDIVTIVLQGPGGANRWQDEKVDVAADWARFFGEPGTSPEQAPPMVGLGLLTDGDDTGTTPSADIADILLTP